MLQGLSQLNAIAWKEPAAINSYASCGRCQLQHQKDVQCGRHPGLAGCVLHLKQLKCPWSFKHAGPDLGIAHLEAAEFWVVWLGADVVEDAGQRLGRSRLRPCLGQEDRHSILSLLTCLCLFTCASSQPVSLHARIMQH